MIGLLLGLISVLFFSTANAQIVNCELGPQEFTLPRDFDPCSKPGPLCCNLPFGTCDPGFTCLFSTPTMTPTKTFTNSPTKTPSVTPTPTITPTITSTRTRTPTPTFSPTGTFIPFPTKTPTISPTKTITPTKTPTTTPTISGFNDCCQCPGPFCFAPTPNTLCENTNIACETILDASCSESLQCIKH